VDVTGLPTLTTMAAPEAETLELAVLVIVGFLGVLMLLERLFRRDRSEHPELRRRRHAVAARKSTTLALVCVGLLVVALVLGRVLLGVMALAGLAVFATLSVVRSSLSRDRDQGTR
jgi:Na+/H+ antiporter NhaD/arsenite permease-like protein